MTTTLFVQIRCKPGTAYNVADEIGLREIHSELYSISGDFDLLLKLHVPSEEDIGRYINDNLLNIEVCMNALYQQSDTSFLYLYKMFLELYKDLEISCNNYQR